MLTLLSGNYSADDLIALDRAIHLAEESVLCEDGGCTECKHKVACTDLLRLERHLLQKLNERGLESNV